MFVDWLYKTDTQQTLDCPQDYSLHNKCDGLKVVTGGKERMLTSILILQ